MSIRMVLQENDILTITYQSGREWRSFDIAENNYHIAEYTMSPEDFAKDDPDMLGIKYELSEEQVKQVMLTLREVVKEIAK